jgi:hypothetical protein
MKRSTVLTEKNRIKWATVFSFLIILPLGLSLVGFAFTRGQEREVFLEAPDPKWEACYRDAEYMRYHHMDLLRDVREEVVRFGIRGGVTLAGCGDCHTNRDQFCDRCHEAASVRLDCYGCHYYPERAAERELARMVPAPRAPEEDPAEVDPAVQDPEQEQEPARIGPALQAPQEGR